jgi:hypothetical protein
MTHKEAVTRVLAEYYRAFSTLTAEAILPYFHEPSMMVGPLGVFALPTGTSVHAAFTNIMDGLRARDYGRSDLSKLKVDRLSATSVLASGVAIRYKADGEELERVGVTYLLQNTNGLWKIAVTIIHDKDHPL